MLKSQEGFSRLKALNVAVGTIFIVLAIVVMLDTALLSNAIILIFGVTLFILGLTRLLIGVYWKLQTPLGKKLRIVTGSIIIAVSIAVMVSAYLISNPILYILLASALILNGLTRIAVAIVNKDFPNWFRIILIIVGLITIAFAIVTIIYAQYGYFTIILLLALIFIFSGFTRILFIALSEK